MDEAPARSDSDLLLVIAFGFGAPVVIQSPIAALRGWALRVVGHLPSFQPTGNLVRHVLRLSSDGFERRAPDLIGRVS